MHTAVQLTFSFEIASMQLTPSFKMGALQLKPTSKIVTMRLAPSQQPQPAMNLQVTFEISTVQLAGNAIGMIRLDPIATATPECDQLARVQRRGSATFVRARIAARSNSLLRSRDRPQSM